MRGAPDAGYRNRRKSLDKHDGIVLEIGNLVKEGKDGPVTVERLGLVVARKKRRWSLPLNGPA